MSNAATVVRAFSYLQALTAYNGVRQRLRRLRQPKYLFGAVAGLAYFYFFVIRHFIGGAASQYKTSFGFGRTLGFALVGGLGFCLLMSHQCRCDDQPDHSADQQQHGGTDE